MKWIITEDRTEDGSGSAVGVGKYRADGRINSMAREVPNPESRLIIMRNEILNPVEFPYDFRLLDDDCEVYLVGRCGDLNQADGDAAFEPLDWASEVMGATTMEYRKAGTVVWSVL